MFNDLSTQIDVLDKVNNDVIYHIGDALEFLKALPNNSVRLTVTSPPYNLGKDYENKTSIEEYLSF